MAGWKYFCRASVNAQNVNLVTWEEYKYKYKYHEWMIIHPSIYIKELKMQNNYILLLPPNGQNVSPLNIWRQRLDLHSNNSQSNAKKKRRKESLIWEMMVIMLKEIADAICSKKVFASNSCNFSVFGDRWNHPLIQIPTWFKLKGGHFLNRFLLF